MATIGAPTHPRGLEGSRHAGFVHVLAIAVIGAGSSRETIVLTNEAAVAIEKSPTPIMICNCASDQF